MVHENKGGDGAAWRRLERGGADAPDMWTVAAIAVVVCVCATMIHEGLGTEECLC